MPNPYLESLRAKYTALQQSIEGFQTRATEAKRDLTEDELRSVKEQGEQAKTLFGQISDLTEIETRNARVAQMQAAITATLTGGDGNPTDNGKGDDVTFRNVGGATTQDRDPGHYTRSSSHSFFRDLTRARLYSDEPAARRLVEHTRALDTGGEGVGTVPPKWMTEEFELLARQGRAVASAVRNIALGDDPRPMTLPKQTAGTDAVVTEQASENDPVTGTDAWDSDVDVVSPKPTSGKQTVSRQMVDMSSPAIDSLIFGDLLSVYNEKVEKKVCNAIIAVGTAITATEAQFLDMSVDDTNGPDLAVRAGLTVRKARKLPANLLVMTTDRWGQYLKLKDASGRPLITEDSDGPMNVVGVGSVNVDGRVKSLGAVVTEGMFGDGDPDVFAAIRASDILLFESNVLRFRFEEVAGPESIVLGIWGYTATIVRQGTKSVKRVEIDTTP